MKANKFKKLLRVLLLLLFTILCVKGIDIRQTDPIEGTRMHISFDDTIDVFIDLTEHEEEYDSIFENKLLGYLKEIHEEYGAVFSLYCFYQNSDNSFNLSMCTDKFASEFVANSDWLRFGFHHISETGNLSESSGEDAVTAYSLIVGELERILGGKQAIDYVVRLSNFAGSYEAIAALSQCDDGIMGLYTADDDRQSYSLSEIDNLYIQNNDLLYDEAMNIVYVSTDLRLEKSLYVYNDLVNISGDSNQNRIIEIFTHEWKCDDPINFEVTKLKILQCCQFAEDYGCEWKFLY